MLEGTKKLLPTDYKKFTDAMIEAAEGEDLPVVLQLKDINNYTLKDVQDLFYDFRRDTSLDITGNLFICEKCGKLHLQIAVDYLEEEPTLLQ